MSIKIDLKGKKGIIFGLANQRSIAWAISEKLFEAGVCVTINSDDPAYFGGYLNKNLIEIQSALNLSIDDIKTLIINSFKASFLTEEKKVEWISKV